MRGTSVRWGRVVRPAVGLGRRRTAVSAAVDADGLGGVQADHEAGGVGRLAVRGQQRADDHRGEGERHGPGGGLGEQRGEPARRPRWSRTCARPRRRGQRRRRPARRSRRRRSAGATRCRAPAAGRTSTRPRRRRARRRRDADVVGEHRQRVGHRDADHGGDPEGAMPPSQRLDQVLREHAGDGDGQPGRRRQERRERAGDEQRGRAARRPCRRPSERAARDHGVGAARGDQVAGVDAARARRTRAAAGRRCRAARAPPASSAARRGRRGWCRSGPPRAAGPWCRGRSR